MANITDPQAVDFANTKARAIANLIESLDRTIDIFLIDVVEDFEDRTGGNANGDVVIVEGLINDSRNPITKQNIAELKFVVEQIKACLDQDDRRTLVHNLVVLGQPIF